MNVSVVIPTYNRKALVTQAIESCRIQSDKDVEIIVVDDGSIDGTVEAVLQQYPDVIVVEQKHSGACAARNKGLSIATREYVLFLDSDDVLAPGILSLHLGHAQAHGADLTYGKWAYCDEHHHQIGSTQGCNWGDLQLSLINGFWSPNFVYLYRKAFLDDHHCTWNADVSLLDDFDFVLQVTLKQPRIAFTPSTIGYYCRHAFDIRTSQADEDFRSRTRIRILERARLQSTSKVEHQLIDTQIQVYSALISMSRAKRIAEFFTKKLLKRRAHVHQ